MTDNSSPIDSKDDPIIKAYLDQDQLVVKFNDLTIKSKVNINDLDFTITELRNELDNQTDNIELKEQIILFVSKNWPAILKSNRVQSYDEWKLGLDKRYYVLNTTIEENMPNL